MGDVADMMLDGALCNCCGVYLDGEEPGYPRWCDDTDCQQMKRYIESEEK
jgi:hypothetical protein